MTVDLVDSLLCQRGPSASRLPAVTVAGRSLELEELRLASGAVANRIAGAPAVAVEAHPSLETLVGVLGGLVAGVPVVPVPPDAGPIERGHILADSAAPLLLVGAPDRRMGKDGPVENISINVREHRAYDGPPAEEAGVAMIVYTSGTTGLPKGVMLTGAAIASCLDALAEAWEWTEEDVLVHGLPLFHVHGLILGMLGSLRVGSHLIHTGKPTPQAYAEAAGAGGTLYFGVPTVWNRVANDPACASALRRARLLVSGSAGLPVPVFERLDALAGQGPIERYGMTETLITVSGRASQGRRPGWVGTPLRGVQTRLVGEDGSRVPCDGDSIGLLEVQAPTLMDGYLNLPDETAAVIGPGGWVRTGDVAAVAPDGWHRIVGRASTDLIKSGGYRIGAGEVESALLAHPAVTEAAVVGEPDDDLGQVIVGYVVAEGVSEADLVSFVGETLSAHKRPRRIVFLGSLPRNAMGKVQKAKLGVDGAP